MLIPNMHEKKTGPSCLNSGENIIYSKTGPSRLNSKPIMPSKAANLQPYLSANMSSYIQCSLDISFKTWLK